MVAFLRYFSARSQEVGADADTNDTAGIGSKDIRVRWGWKIFINHG